MKKLIFKLAILLLIVAVVIGGVMYFNGSKDEGANIGEVLEDAAELTTQKLTFSNVLESSKGSIPILTKKNYLVYYSTTAYAGFDMSEVEHQETDSKITVYIPHCKVDEDTIKIASEDIKLYDTNFAIFKIDEEAMLQIIGEAENNAKEYASSVEAGLLEAADENAKRLVKNLIEPIAGGREVVVEFK